MTPFRLQKVITYTAATSAITAALEHAQSNGWLVAVAILDPGGNPVAMARMDGVAPAILDIAIDKAWTACLGRSTQAFADRMTSSAQMTLGAANRTRTCAWEGGLPIYAEATLIGTIGVSGAAGHEDAACAMRGIAALGLDTVPSVPSSID